ncbi:DMT family transporter [Agromyces terreus]|uniref:DMT family transporter n=1 Tax=Agromyces terreus TaxID=424795 RepID=UPI0031CF1773
MRANLRAADAVCKRLHGRSRRPLAAVSRPRPGLETLRSSTGGVGLETLRSSTGETLTPVEEARQRRLETAALGLETLRSSTGETLRSSTGGRFAPGPAHARLPTIGGIRTTSSRADDEGSARAYARQVNSSATSASASASAVAGAAAASAPRSRGNLSTLLQFIAMGLVWGSSFLFMKVALEGVSFGQVAWSRTVLGGLALGVIVLIMRPRVARPDGTPGPVLPRERIVWVHFLVVSVTTCVIPYLCFAWAEQYVSSSLASIYNATTPIMTALMATLVFRVERLGLSRWAGVGVGILGVVVVIGPWQYSALTGSLAGQLACLVATLCYGFTFGYQRRFLSHRPIAPATFAFLSIGVSAVVMLVLTPWLALDAVDLDLAAGGDGWPIVGSLLALGVLGTGLAYIWNINVLRAWGPTATSTVTYVTPIVGVALGFVLLGERFSWHEPIGALLVLLGILLAQGRLRMPRRRARG